MSVSEYPSVNYSQCITMNHEIRYTQACPERIYTEPSRSSRRIAQKPLIMQNKPNFQKAQMNASTVLRKDYGNWTLGERGKNKPNTNPIQSQFKPKCKKAEMNASAVLTKDYNEKWTMEDYAKQTQNKPNQTQNKPNFTGSSLLHQLTYLFTSRYFLIACVNLSRFLSSHSVFR